MQDRATAPRLVSCYDTEVMQPPPAEHEVTLDGWIRHLDSFLASQGLSIRSQHFTRAGLENAYNANESPQEFYERLKSKGQLPNVDPIPTHRSKPNAGLQGWGVIQSLIGVAILYFGWSINVAAPGTQIANVDLEFQRLAIIIGGEATILSSAIYFCAGAIVNAVRESK